MNFFFGIKSDIINCKLSIPKFKNTGEILYNISLYSAEIDNNKNKWKIVKIENDEDENFFILNNNSFNNEKVFFLGKKKDFSKDENENGDIFLSSLRNFNKYTDTEPQFRANFKIFNEFGFSSYQSDYPFSMIDKNGNILSPLNILLNKNSQKNFIFFKNLFFKPIQEEFNIYFINYKLKKIITIKKIFTNKLNIIEVEKNLLEDNMYIFSDRYVGIPLFVSINNDSISLEHTHPPHHYLLDDAKFKIIKQKKNEFIEIIS